MKKTCNNCKAHITGAGGLDECELGIRRRPIQTEYKGYKFFFHVPDELCPKPMSYKELIRAKQA